jgi:hypothetical protein
MAEIDRRTAPKVRAAHSRRVDAKISEHGHANALDVRAFKLAPRPTLVDSYTGSATIERWVQQSLTKPVFKFQPARFMRWRKKWRTTRS